MLLVLAMRRERLTRCASYENLDVKLLQAFPYFLTCDFAHILAYEGAFAVIRLVGVLARVIEIIANNDVNSAGTEAIGEPSNAAEKVNSPNAGIAVACWYVCSRAYYGPRPASYPESLRHLGVNRQTGCCNNSKYQQVEK